jgi:hypothetical protein
MKIPNVTTVLMFAALSAAAQAQSTAFTYQGRLNDSGSPANGTYDLRFAIHDAESGGGVVAGPLTNSAVIVSNGLFATSLDFGGTPFDVTGRWLQVEVRPSGSGAFVPLGLRQALTATPYAIRAGGAAAGSITSAMLADGAVTSAKIAPGAVNQLGSPDGSPVNAVQVNTNGLVGLGTNAPHAGLHIAEGDLIYGPQILLQQADETNPFGYSELGGARDVAVSGLLIAVAASADAAVSPVILNFPAIPLPQPELRASNGYTNLAGAGAVAFSGTLLAVAAFSSDAVTLVDMSAPAVPVKRAELRDGLGGFNELDGAADVAFSGSLLAIAAANDDAVTLVSVTNPASPVLRTVLKDGQFGFDFLNGANDVAFNGNLLAIAAGSDNAITLVDTTTPATPVLRTVIRDGMNGFDQLAGVSFLTWSGNMLIAAASTDDSVTLIDCTVPTSPVLLATLTDGVGGIDSLDTPGGIAIQNNLLAVTAGGTDNAVTLIDVANLAQPVVRGVWRDGQAGLHFLNQPGGVAFSGQNLVVTSSGDNAFSVITPQPQEAALVSEGWIGIGTTRPAAALHVVGNLVVQGADGVKFQTQSFAAGDSTEASGPASTAFGSGTSASGPNSTAMGFDTTASGLASVAMGYRCEAIGSTSFTMGNLCLASNTLSFALGNRAQAVHDGAFVWADMESAAFSSTTANQFRLRAAGGMEVVGGTNQPALRYSGARAGGFGTPVGLAENFNTGGQSAPALRVVNYGGDSADGALSVSTAGTGYIASFGNSSAFVSRLSTNGTWTALAFTPTSDRNAKENFARVNPREVLDKVAALPVVRWNYKAAPGLSHIGPVAQDFHAAFGLNGDDDKHIATVDADGVALAAIQGLNQKVEEQAAALKTKDTEMKELRQSMAELKAVVAKLTRE